MHTRSLYKSVSEFRILYYSYVERAISFFPPILDHQLARWPPREESSTNQHRRHRCHPLHQQKPIKYHSNGLIHSFATIATCYSRSNRCSLTLSQPRRPVTTRCLRTIESDPLHLNCLSNSHCRSTTTHLLSPCIVTTSSLLARRQASPSHRLRRHEWGRI
jgi:hypothetical protein